MALSMAVVSAGLGDNVDGTTLTSNSGTPTANCLVIVAILARNGTAAAEPADPDTVVGQGITFTKIRKQYNGERRAVWLYAGSSSSPSTGTVVATWGSINVTGIIAVDQTNVEVDMVAGVAANAFVQTASDFNSLVTNVSASVAYTYPVADKHVSYMICGIGEDGTFVAKTGYTALCNARVGSGLALFTQYKVGESDQAVSCTWDSANDSTFAAIAAEIRVQSKLRERDAHYNPIERSVADYHSMVTGEAKWP